jgi:hypothetical protein
LPEVFQDVDLHLSKQKEAESALVTRSWTRTVTVSGPLQKAQFPRREW